MRITVIAHMFILSLMIGLMNACAYQSQLTRQAQVTATVEPQMIKEEPQKGNRWAKSKVPLGSYGDVIVFGSGGRVVIAGLGTLLLSLDGGQSWQSLSGGKGDQLYTIDGGLTYRADYPPDMRPSSSIRVKDLCSVENAAIEPSGWLYLRTVCEHSTAMWGVPTGDTSGLWHVRSFTSNEKEPDDGVYTPGINFAVAGERVLVDAILPEGPALLTTDDKGATWYPFWGPQKKTGAIGFDFINERQGWILQGDGKLFQTSDGGRTWELVSTLPAPLAKQASSLDFVDTATGFIAGDGGLILVTNDGGLSWQPQASGVKQNIYKVQAANAKRAWAVGEKGTVLETSDGGAHWQKVDLGLSKDIRTLAIKDGVAWIIVDDYLYHSL